ncbi:unnamed protein product [Periconia digitata]|uniref:Uncharacterized protein n=1 Tax=Periconia digitata TaxID=1303443 RepID=A0A9W4U6S6_9PLEO|nr:unnamed protein product [Periconia digitata]
MADFCPRQLALLEPDGSVPAVKIFKSPHLAMSVVAKCRMIALFLQVNGYVWGVGLCRVEEGWVHELHVCLGYLPVTCRLAQIPHSPKMSGPSNLHIAAGSRNLISAHGSLLPCMYVCVPQGDHYSGS